MNDNEWTEREQGTHERGDDVTRAWNTSDDKGLGTPGRGDSSEDRTRAFTASREPSAQNDGAAARGDSSEDRTRAFTAPNESGARAVDDSGRRDAGSAVASGERQGRQPSGQYGQSSQGPYAQGQAYGQQPSSIGQGFSGQSQYDSAPQGGAGYGSSNPAGNVSQSQSQNRYDSAAPAGGQYGAQAGSHAQAPGGQYGQNSHGSQPQGAPYGQSSYGQNAAYSAGDQYGQSNRGENAPYGQGAPAQDSSIGQGFASGQHQFGSAPQGGAGYGSSNPAGHHDQFGSAPQGQYGQNHYGFGGQGGPGDHGGQPGQPGQFEQPYGQSTPWPGGNANGGNSPFGAGGQGAAAALQVKNPDGSLRLGRVGLLASLAAQFFVILGCLGPWASVWGSSVSGMNGDGVIVLVLSLAVIGLGVAHLLGKVPAKFLWGIVVAAAISFVVGLIDFGNISGVASVGWGLVFVIFFSFVSGGAAALAALRD